MANRIEWLQRQRAIAAADVEAITDHATDEDRDLTEAEQRTCEMRRSRVEQLDSELEIEVQSLERAKRFAELTADVGTEIHTGEVVRRSRESTPVLHEYKSPGEYLTDFCMRAKDERARNRFDTYVRALAHQITTENPGIIPTPIVGPVIAQANERRPALLAATMRPLPSAGKTFQRPMISQHTLAGLQAAEKAELPSQPMKIDPVTVTKATYGGAVNLSWQDRDWTDPAIMDLLVADLANAYAKQTDMGFCTYFLGTVTQTQGVTDPTDGGDWLSAIYAAAATVYAGGNNLPDTIWVSTDVWAMLGSLFDLNGRPLFPTVGPGNSMGNLSPTSFGGSVGGIRLVVDAHFPAKTAVVGDSTKVEVYEQIGGQVSAIEPSVLGTVVAYYGYIAWLTLLPSAFVKLTLP